MFQMLEFYMIAFVFMDILCDFKIENDSICLIGSKRNSEDTFPSLEHKKGIPPLPPTWRLQDTEETKNRGTGVRPKSMGQGQ